MSFALHVLAFQHGAEIPGKHTCSGADLSPALEWSAIPHGARAMALIVDDPDAPVGTWTHWLIWNIPSEPARLPEGVPAERELSNGARQGVNDFKRIGYGGPCPPPGKPHRYFFRLYALDAQLDLRAGSSRMEMERAMKGHVLSQAEWMGTFRR